MNNHEPDPTPLWTAIQEAAEEHRETELAEIAINLYGELDDAKAEIVRLRTALQSSLRALSPSHLGAW